MNHFTYGLKAAEYKDLESKGFSALAYAPATTNPWAQVSAGSRISLFVIEKGAYAAQVEAAGHPQTGGSSGSLSVKAVVNLPEKDYVGWKSMQDNLDYLRPYPASTWGEGASGQLRKISEKDSKVILRSLEMTQKTPKPEKPAAPAAAAAPKPA